jgi:hypothetical protein
MTKVALNVDERSDDLSAVTSPSGRVLVRRCASKSEPEYLKNEIQSYHKLIKPSCFPGCIASSHIPRLYDACNLCRLQFRNLLQFNVKKH